MTVLELFLTVCNMIAVPVWIGFGISLLFFMVAVGVGIDGGSQGERFREASKKAFKFTVLFGIVGSISTFPYAIIESRIQLVKLEITDEAVRQEVYQGFQRVLDKVEKRFLGPDSVSSEETK